MKCVLFLEESPRHLPIIRSVAAAVELSQSDFEILRLNATTGLVVGFDEQLQPNGMPPGVGWTHSSFVRAAWNVYRESSPGCKFVLPQDARGRTQILAQIARRRGAIIVLLPDGAMTPGRTENSRSRKLARAKNLVSSILGAALGVAPGRRGFWLGSNPDLVLGWGEGWRDGFEQSRLPGAWHSVGSVQVELLKAAVAERGVRIDTSDRVRHLLVCSQPMARGREGFSADEWYSWLHSLLREAESHVDVRLRPHPAETLPATFATLSVDDSSRSLCEDLLWADAVVAPASTLVLEAAWLGLPVAVALPGGKAELARRMPAMARRGVPVLDTRDSSFTDVIALVDGAVGVDRVWLDRLCVDPTGAAARVAWYLRYR